MCFLFHKWGKWSDPKPGEISYSHIDKKRDVMIQVRFCETCNQRELREAY